ncbi:MAG: tRNA epoxyqueuosine(34) reductase QueG [Chlorobiaceae bacterium]|nr:tRNA epoxyqueuosine(34) reductase QueG [Chlorobiaceae bacterium]
MDYETATLKESIREKARGLGFLDVGFASVKPQGAAMDHIRKMVAEGRHGEMGYIESGMNERENPAMLFPGARTIISAALPWPERQIPYDPRGTVSSHAVIPDYHKTVRDLLLELLEYISLQHDARVNGMVCVDSSPVLEKAWAEAAGIGKTGKNTLLIVPGGGSRIFLGELLLDIAIEPDEPLDWEPCGSCRACLESCPTGALIQAGMLDATRCISYLTIELKREFTGQEASMTEGWLYGCDRCTEVCPHNEVRPGSRRSVFTPIEPLVNLTARNAMELTGSGFRKLFAGTPGMRLGLRRLKRNARAVLGNEGKKRAQTDKS